MSQNELPDLDFSPEAIKETAKKKTLPNGAWFRFLVTKQDTKVNEKSGNVGTRLGLRALKDPNDASSTFGAPASNNITWPFRNKGFVYPETTKDHKKGDPHEAPDTEGMVIQFLNALDPSFPTYPRWVEGKLMYKGEEIPEDQNDAKREEVVSEIYNTLKKVYANPEYFINEAFYAQVAVDGNFTNVKNIRADLPEGVEYGVAPSDD